MKIILDIPSADAPVTEAELMDKVLPGLFVNTAAISTYGRQVGTSTAMAELDRLMESSPVSRLAKLLREIVAKLRDADPELVSRKPSFLARVLGADVEQRVVYDTARSTLDTLLAQAEKVAQEVRAAIDLTDRLIGSHDDEVVWLELHVRCGRRFLEMHSQAAAQPGTPTMFESPHARLERRLDNLETLRLSHEMSLTQMHLARSRAIDMLDRYAETSTTLVPVWRRHVLTLHQSADWSDAAVEQAAQAHNALVRSLDRIIGSAGSSVPVASHSVLSMLLSRLRQSKPTKSTP